MSISINVAGEKIKILKSIKKQPELIFTDLYSPDDNYITSLNNFFYQIYCDSLHITDFIKKNISEYLRQFLWYKNCDVSVGQPNIIKIQLFEAVIFKKWITIVEIDLAKKRYTFVSSLLDFLKERCEEEITLNLESIDDRIKRDLDLLNRNYFLGILMAIKRGIKFHEVRYLPLVIAILSIPKKRKQLRNKLNNELEDLETHNKHLREKYQEEIENQKLYREEYPRYERIIKGKQKHISEFLKGFGYVKVEINDL